MNRRELLQAGAAAFGMLACGPIHAQSYPLRPVRLILGFPPGGSGDTLARTLQPELTRQLGQQLLVENRPGAATNIASEFVAKSLPDGYTLLLGGSFSHSVNPALFAKLPFDAQKDFVPITRVTTGSSVFVVPATLPVASLQEFISYARREGPRVSYASSGIGSPGHIAGAYFNKLAGLQMTHVPYKGAGDAVRDLASGQVQMTVTSIAAIQPLVRQGRARMLALTTPGRSRQAPEVPGSDEAGLADFNMDGWYGVFAPAGTPLQIAEQVLTAFRAALEHPDTAARLEGQGLVPQPSRSLDEFARFVREDAQRWVGVVRESGAKVE